MQPSAAPKVIDLAAFVRRNVYMIIVAKGLLMANRLMPYALNLTPAPVTGGTPVAAGSTPSGRTRATDLQMSRVAEISPVRRPSEVRVVTATPCRSNLSATRRVFVILCSATGELSDVFTRASKFCAVTLRARPIGISTLEVALSIRRVIRANFTRCVGILAVKRPAAVPAEDDPAVWK